MAVIITEPLGETINYTEWARLIQKTTLEAGGFMALGLTNMNDTGAPQIANGSRVEVGESLYKCMADETIGGTAAAGVCYIYCNPAGSAAGFTYSAAAPQWNAVKGGWYDGNSRAVAKLYFTGSGGGNQYNGKVILDGYNAIRAVNMEQAVPETGGVLFASAGVNTETMVDLPPGAYRVEIKGGKGGKGGNATADGEVTGYGGDGAGGESVSVSVITKDAETIVVSAGGDGEDGADGGEYDGAGGGGGGGSGGMSYAVIRGLLHKAFGGSGGGGSGGGNDGRDGGGGGGGGGYGQGEAGDNLGRTDGGGKGGNNGEGGDGGKGGIGSGDIGSNSGGSGGGGSGYNGGGTSPAATYRGENGGGYGEAGGDGGVSHNAGDVVGKGGSSQNMTGGLNRTFNNLFQGGGGGGKANDGTGGNGGGLKSASSGYVRIFRMW